MRTTIDIPEDLLIEAQDYLGYKSKTDTIIFSLRELIRKKNIEHLKSLAGNLELKIDISKSRRRSENK